MEAAVEQPSDLFLGDADSSANLCIRVELTQLPKWPAQLIDERSYPRGEMEGAHVCGQIIFKFLPDMAHPLDHLFGMLGQAQSCRRGDQPFATPYEEFRVELFGKAMDLKTAGAGAYGNFFCGKGHARRGH